MTAATEPRTQHDQLLRPVKEALLGSDPDFFRILCRQTKLASTFEEAMALSTLRRRAARRGLVPQQKPLRLALLGGCSLFPLHELADHFLTAADRTVEIFKGDYDNYMAEILDESSRLYEFRPDAIFLIPSAMRCCYSGGILDSREQQYAQAMATANQILELCRVAHERTRAEIVLANFPLPCRFDPGPLRSRNLASDWNFRKTVNLELGLNAPSSVHICDVEFLSARRGTVVSTDDRAWFESKQPYSPPLMLDVARETAHILQRARGGQKKLIVLDLDNTLWGGVVGDDGLEGIEIGDTSPRGEAFKAFQKRLLELANRGVLLAVASKNDDEKAREPFEKHPEMALKLANFVSFQANWEPKSDNIRRIAAELNLGLDSFVFIDDNPAEIEIVQQFVPEVECILLGPDPAEYAGMLQDCRFFEPASITAEDLERVEQYKTEKLRQDMAVACADMDSYLQSLEMTAEFTEFRPVDVPRIAQLINKSNQFNVTTRRRSEVEVQDLIANPALACFTARLADRFGDHGLISIVIGEAKGDEIEIDTWLMSCRVLKRQVEEEVLNEVARLAKLRGCRTLRGVYLKTAKNNMVRDLFGTLGFTPVLDQPERREFVLDLETFQPHPTKITVHRRAYES